MGRNSEQGSVIQMRIWKPSNIDNCWCLEFSKGCWEAVERAGCQEGSWGPLTLKWQVEEAEKEQLESVDGQPAKAMSNKLGVERSGEFWLLLKPPWYWEDKTYKIPSFEKRFPGLPKKSRKVQKHGSR